MRYAYHMILLLLFPLSAWGECDTLFYMHRLKMADKNDAFRLECLDSLIAAKKSGIDSLLIEKMETAYSLGRYEVAADAYEGLQSAYPSGRSLSESLKLQLHYIHSLHGTKRLRECLAQCMQVLRMDKPDSLRYYDTWVDCMLLNFNKHTSMLRSQKYLERNEALLKEAEDKGWPTATVDNIKYGYYTICMQDASGRGDFDKALAYTDYISPLPLSKNQRNALNTNIAYFYMRLGKYDLAEECFKKALESGTISYNTGVSLLNYTHMLNQQGRYKETLEMLDKYADIGKCLDHDIYSSYLLGNRAMAESKVLGYEKAFATLLRSKEVGDSIAYSSGVQDGLLMLEGSEKDTAVASLEQKLMTKTEWLWVCVGLVVICLIVIALVLWLERRKGSQVKTLLASLEDSDSKCKQLEKAYTELSQTIDSKIATQLLQVAAAEATLDMIEYCLRDTEEYSDEVDKIRAIEDVLASSEAKRDARERFERHFEQAHAKFFRNLYAAYPNLTPGEVRMCGYIIMNLSNKEIAAVTNRSVRSVESTRYRIGKKLELADGESVVCYLRRFL